MGQRGLVTQKSWFYNNKLYKIFNSHSYIELKYVHNVCIKRPVVPLSDFSSVMFKFGPPCVFKIPTSCQS